MPTGSLCLWSSPSESVHPKITHAHAYCAKLPPLSSRSLWLIPLFLFSQQILMMLRPKCLASSLWVWPQIDLTLELYQNSNITPFPRFRPPQNGSAFTKFQPANPPTSSPSMERPRTRWGSPGNKLLPLTPLPPDPPTPHPPRIRFAFAPDQVRLFAISEAISITPSERRLTAYHEMLRGLCKHQTRMVRKDTKLIGCGLNRTPESDLSEHSIWDVNHSWSGHCQN